MAIEVKIPRLGWSMEEGVFGEWIKKDGDTVEPGDVLYTMESEKALQEVESIDGGILRILEDGPGEGDTVLVGALLGWLLQPGEEVPGESTSGDGTRASGAAVSASEQTPQETPLPVPSTPTATAVQPVRPAASVGQSQSSVIISPRAARRAAELGVDVTGLTGSGRGGRIRERDVLAGAKSAH